MAYPIAFTRASLLALLTLTIAIDAIGQPAFPCPPNIDLSFGNFSGWALSKGLSNCGGICGGTGTMIPIFGSPLATTAATSAGRIALTTGAGNDVYGGFPITAPGGGFFSMCLGKDSAGYRAERARYTLHIPVGNDDYSFTYRFAAVFNDTGFHATDAPAFTVRAIDSATGLPLPCADFSFTSTSPGTLRAATTAPIRYLPWTLKTMNLSGQGGKTIFLEVTALSCGDGGHWAYGYFDVISCKRFRVDVSYCDIRVSIANLSAPPGYANYQWYKNAPGTGAILANGPSNSINIVLPAVGDFYYCILTPFPNQGCVDTVKSSFIKYWTIQAQPNSRCNNLDSLTHIWVNVYGRTGYTTNWNGNVDVLGPFDAYGRLPVAVKPGERPLIVVTVTDSIGCFWQDTIKDRPKLFSLAPLRDTATCPGVPVNFTPTLTPSGLNYTYRWRGTNVAALLTDSTSLNTMFISQRSGYDTLILHVSAQGCETMDSIRVKTLDTLLTLKSSDTVCQDELYTAQLQGDSGFHYQWLPVAGIAAGQDQWQHPQLATDATRTYVVTASHPGCRDIIRTLKLTVEPFPLVAIPGDTVQVCEGEQLALTASVNPAGNYTFQWAAQYGLNILPSGQATFSGYASTPLFVTANTPHGCSGTDSAWVQVNPRPSLFLKQEDSIYIGETYQMSPVTNATSFSWTPAGSLSDASIQRPVARPSQSTRYVLMVSNEGACTATDTFLLRVIDAESLVAVPNAFTPGSGANNILKVLAKGPVSLQYFRVYNRWGTLLFETSDRNNGWDGTYQARPQPNGVYVYTLRAATNKSGFIEKSGNVTLLR